MDRNTHKKLISDYIAAGGNQLKVKMISSFSLQNHAKLKSLIKQLNPEPLPEPEVHSVIERKVLVDQSKRKESKFSDLISNYPSELHSVFKKRYDYWLEACSLKQQLNEVDRLDEGTALNIQWKILENINAMDECQAALDYFKENKRILPTETKMNFDSLSPLEIINKRNNLRSNITKRSKTLRLMESELPTKDSPDYNLKLHLINRKKEQIQEYINQVSELDKMINKR